MADHKPAQKGPNQGADLKRKREAERAGNAMKVVIPDLAKNPVLRPKKTR